MDCEDRYWKWSEEANAEHAADLISELRHTYALDEPEPPDEWVDSEESWRVARKVDRLAASVETFVGSGFANPQPGFALELETIRGLRIRKVLREHPFAPLRSDSSEAKQPSQPYVAIDTEAEAMLRTLVHHRLGYERCHWNVARVIEAAAASIVVNSERGRVYLGRMLLCYILELDDEVLVWSRAVLEAELESLLDEVLDAPTTRLVELIDKAGCRGLLSGSAFEAADRVRTAGNDTLHVLPGLWSTAAVLRDLQIVLNALGCD